MGNRGQGPEIPEREGREDQKKMAAENGMKIPEFDVDRDIGAGERDNHEETSEISLSPDLEAEEARKEELRLQAQKVT